MEPTSRPSPNLLYRRLAVVCVLGAMLLYGLKYFSKFPHVGSWTGIAQQDTEGAYLTKVSFRSNGSCSWELNPVPPNSAPNFNTYDCSYKMSGGAANVTLVLKDVQWLAGSWHFATTAKQKALAPLYDSKFYYRVTPFKEGEELFAESEWMELVEQKTGDSRYYPNSDQQTLKRLAP